MIAIGEESVGKTTFLTKLIENSTKFPSQIHQSNFDFNQTNKLEKTNLGVNLMEIKPTGKDFLMNIFDFNGEEIYYNIHSFFLSKESIFLLLFDGSKSIDHNRIAQWIHSILSRAPTAYIFLIGTHFEEKKSSKLYLQNNLELKSIIENIKFLDHIHQLHFISPKKTKLNDHSLFWRISLKNTNLANPNGLITRIINLADLISNQKMIRSIPRSWILLRHILFPNLDILKEYFEDNQFIEGKTYFEKIYMEEIGIILGKDLKILAEIFEIGDQDLDRFIDLLCCWGEIIFINNPMKNYSFVLLKPNSVISLFKLIIRSFHHNHYLHFNLLNNNINNDNDNNNNNDIDINNNNNNNNDNNINDNDNKNNINIVNKIKNKIKNKYNYEDDHHKKYEKVEKWKNKLKRKLLSKELKEENYFITKKKMIKILSSNFPSKSVDEMNQLFDDIFIPLFTELKLLFHIGKNSNLFLISSLLKGKKNSKYSK